MIALNHELVHNYVLMGLSRAQQAEIEESYWILIEANTGQAIDAFLRDYLVLLHLAAVLPAFRRVLPTGPDVRGRIGRAGSPPSTPTWSTPWEVTPPSPDHASALSRGHTSGKALDHSPAACTLRAASRAERRTRLPPSVS
jgi:hypothetical protein